MKLPGKEPALTHTEQIIDNADATRTTIPLPRRATIARSGETGAPRSDWDVLVEQHLALARRIATRYAGRGEPLDDLAQVAMLGLVKAAQRFDPDRGTDFARYAVPTILGELRRHFRDTCWAVRVPRRLQELALQVNDAAATLTGELDRAPTESEIAERLGVTPDEVRESRGAAAAYSALSLDAPASSDHASGSTVAEQLPDDGDDPLDLVEAKQALHSVIAKLPERERHMLTLRYYGERTQRQIADDLHISQMHVSRLMTQTLTRLRAHLIEGHALPSEWEHDSSQGPNEDEADHHEPA